MFEKLNPIILNKLNIEKYLLNFSWDLEIIRNYKINDIIEISNLFIEKDIVDFDKKDNILNRLFSLNKIEMENAFSEAKLWYLILQLWIEIKSEVNINNKNPEFYIENPEKNVIELITQWNSKNTFVKNIQTHIEKNFPNKSNNYEFIFNEIPKDENSEKEIKKYIREAILKNINFQNQNFSFSISEYTQEVSVPYFFWMKWVLKISTTENKNFIFNYDEITDLKNQLKRKNEQIKQTKIPTILFIQLDSGISPSSYENIKNHLDNLILERKIVTSYIKNLVFYTSWYYDSWFSFKTLFFYENPNSNYKVSQEIINYFKDKTQ